MSYLEKLFFTFVYAAFSINVSIAFAILFVADFVDMLRAIIGHPV